MASANKMTCPICCEVKTPADEYGHCSYACASGGGSSAAAPTKSKKRAPALTVTPLADGRIQLSGATFDIRDQIKARGGRWDPAARVWTLPAGTDTTCFLGGGVAATFAPPPPAVVTAPLFFRRSRNGRCCSAATTRLDDENPWGPMWYDCKTHGSWKSSYTGD